MAQSSGRRRLRWWDWLVKVSRQALVAVCATSALVSAGCGEKHNMKYAASDEQWIPFSIPDDRHIVVSARINGTPSEIIIDSGAGNMVLSTSFAAQLGLNEDGSVLGLGVAGSSLGQTVQAPVVSVGNIVVRPRIANVFDLDKLSAIAGRPIVAIIGRDLFDKFVADIDFEHNQIAFRPSEIANQLVSATRLPLNKESHWQSLDPYRD